MQESKSHQASAKARGPRRRIFTGAVAVVGSAGLAAAVLLPSGTALAAYQQSTPSTGSTSGTIDVSTAIALTSLTGTFTLTGSPGDTVSTASYPAVLATGDDPVTGLPLTAALLANPGDPVNFFVMTNNTTGYNVTVTPATNDFTRLVGSVNPLLPVNVTTNPGVATQLGSFPATDLNVRETPWANTAAGQAAGTDPDTYPNTITYPLGGSLGGGATAGWLPLGDAATPVTVWNQTGPSIAGTVGTPGDGDPHQNDYAMTIPAVPGNVYSLTVDYVATTNI
jgi:hypothetical protein